MWHAILKIGYVKSGRQKPPTANGFAFFILEDGPIISADLWQSHSSILQTSQVLLVEGTVEAGG